MREGPGGTRFSTVSSTGATESLGNQNRKKKLLSTVPLKETYLSCVMLACWHMYSHVTWRTQDTRGQKSLTTVPYKSEDPKTEESRATVPFIGHLLNMRHASSLASTIGATTSRGEPRTPEDKNFGLLSLSKVRNLALLSL